MRMRIARPTLRLEAMSDFYERGIGLRRIGSFEGHDGYTGVVFGMPDERAQLELTTRAEAAAPPPTPDSHLVIYFDQAKTQAEVVERLRRMRYARATPHNPWWRTRSDAFLDPDGWEVILVRPDAAD